MKWIVNIGIFVAVCYLAVSVGDFEYDESEELGTQTANKAERVISDLKLAGFSSGSHLNYTIESKRLQQNPVDGIGHIEEPFVSHYSQDGYWRTARAVKGVYYESSNYLVLEDDVVITVVENVNSDPIISRSNSLRFNLDSSEDKPLQENQEN